MKPDTQCGNFNYVIYMYSIANWSSTTINVTLIVKKIDKI